ncbi:transmembrane protein 35B-like [Ostrea edulis]|uniref:transmembrane protein 35B-like n=1 Tax=Ostrea edulis TaxID=37623 RepID=UPI0020942FDA|nr:transmembrane protein 35B-like [Ostrea edulis]
MGFIGNLDIALTWILPCLFIVDGCLKVFPFNIELYGEIAREFQDFSNVCPLTWLGYTPNPDNYRIFVGVYEVACSIAVLTSGELKTVATGILALISGGAVYTHIALADSTSAIPPAVTGIFLLFLCFRAYLETLEPPPKQPKYKIPKKFKIK